MKKYKANDLLGIYKLIEFSYRKVNDYYWKVECQKCLNQSILKLNKVGMEKTKFCHLCVKEKYAKYKTPEEYIKAKIDIDSNGCWLWKGHISKKNGYCLSKYRSIQKKAHSFSYETFKGKIPKGKCVCHSCDIRHCVNPNHLWIGTHLENMKDCKEKKRFNPPRGEICGTSKLTWAKVKKIRELLSHNIEQKKIAKKFNISRSIICGINKNKIWRI